MLRVMEPWARCRDSEFVPVEMRLTPILNRPLPIGFDKTHIPAVHRSVETDMLEIRKERYRAGDWHGTGYQAAVLAELAHKGTASRSSRRSPSRREAAWPHRLHQRRDQGRQWLSRSADTHLSTGKVTAAPDRIPPALINHLSPGQNDDPGRLVPHQQLILVEKSANGRLATREVLPVRFRKRREPSLSRHAGAIPPDT